jgi:protein kinase
MDKYVNLVVIGDGTYGTVSKGTNKLTGEIVAIKKMKRAFNSIEEAKALKEVEALQNLKHPNIIRIKELVLLNKQLSFIFEFMEGNVFDLIKGRTTPLPENTLKSVIY